VRGKRAEPAIGQGEGYGMRSYLQQIQQCGIEALHFTVSVRDLLSGYNSEIVLTLSEYMTE